MAVAITVTKKSDNTTFVVSTSSFSAIPIAPADGGGTRLTVPGGSYVVTETPDDIQTAANA